MFKDINFLIEGVTAYMRTYPEWIKNYMPDNLDKDKWIVTNEKESSSEPNEAEADAEEIDEDDKKLILGPFKAIPNVRKFKVEVGAQNSVFALFGIKSKFSPTFLYEPYLNHSFKKYMLISLKSLRTLARSDPIHYGKRVDDLMKHSTVFFASGLMHVHPKGHRDSPHGTILSLYKKYVEIANSKELNVHYVRKYIKKANGKLRPLGVPSMEGRIYTHILNNFLMIYHEENNIIGDSQHGFRTGRGCLTAGRKILNEVIEADGIYEFDLSRCFDNIGVKAVSSCLENSKTPKEWIEKIEYMNMTPVSNVENLDRYQKESNQLNKDLQRTHGLMEDAYRNPDELGEIEFYGDPESFFKLIPEMRGFPIKEFMLDLHMKVRDAHIELRKKLRKSEGLEFKKETYVEEEVGIESQSIKGLPQGLPTSPYLTILALETYLVRTSKEKIIMYADDGLFFGKGPAPLESDLLRDNPEMGIIFNREKSRWVKRENKWEIALKFLGMTFDGKTLAAATRPKEKIKKSTKETIPAASLVYDKENLVKIDNGLQELANSESTSKDRNIEGSKKRLYGSIRSEETGKDLASSRLFGMIQSRMYQDSGEMKDYEQDFRLTYLPNSGLGDQNKYKKASGGKAKGKASPELETKEMSVFNASSFAIKHLIDTISAKKQPYLKTEKENSGHTK